MDCHVYARAGTRRCYYTAASSTPGGERSPARERAPVFAANINHTVCFRVYFFRPAQGLFRFLREVAHRFMVDECPKLAASLAYTTLLALVPLVTIGLAVFSAFPAFETFSIGVHDFLARTMLPATVEQIVAAHLEQFTRSAGRLTALGMAVLGITALLLMQTIDAAMQRIFAVQRTRPLMLRVLTYWGVLTLGPLLIGASVSISSYVVTASLGENQRASVVLLDTVPVLLTVVAFTLLYKVVPNRRVSTFDALVGGICAAVLFELMKGGFTFYIARFPTYTLIYGAFAAIPIFLVWIYLSWLVVLLGAVIAATLPESRLTHSLLHEVRRDSMSLRMHRLLSVLRVLVEAQQRGAALSAQGIAERGRLSLPATEQMLEKLAAEDWVVRTSGERWALNCDTHTVTVAEIYARLIYGNVLEDELTARLARVSREVLDIPLARLAPELERAET